jgi:hypothetical protein
MKSLDRPEEWAAPSDDPNELQLPQPSGTCNRHSQAANGDKGFPNCLLRSFYSRESSSLGHDVPRHEDMRR